MPRPPAAPPPRPFFARNVHHEAAPAQSNEEGPKPPSSLPPPHLVPQPKDLQQQLRQQQQHELQQQLQRKQQKEEEDSRLQLLSEAPVLDLEPGEGAEGSWEDDEAWEAHLEDLRPPAADDPEEAEADEWEEGSHEKREPPPPDAEMEASWEGGWDARKDGHQRYTDEEWRRWRAERYGDDGNEGWEKAIGGGQHGRGQGKGNSKGGAKGGRNRLGTASRFLTASRFQQKRQRGEDGAEGEGVEPKDAEQGKGGERDGKGGKKHKGKGKGKGKRKGKKKFSGDPAVDQEAPEKFAPDMWEEPREKTGLKLLGELAPRNAKWHYVLRDDSRRSYAAYFRNALNKSHTGKFFPLIRDETDWLQPSGPNGVFPRKTAWLVKKGCQCTYRYGGVDVPHREYPRWMYDVMRVVMPMCGVPQEAWPDACNVNLYTDGNNMVGWHSDDERLFQGKFQDVQIISLSLGQARKFELRINHPDKNEKRLSVIRAGDGDLITMEGMTQKHFQHRVPREVDVDAPRINLTWRYILMHNTRCPVRRNRCPVPDAK